jgi:hypothetical protein
VIARGPNAKAIILIAALALSACATPEGGPPPQRFPAPPIIRSAPPTANVIAPPPAGTNEDALRAEFGMPDFVRNETESQLWRYDGNDCALFFFLYRDAGSYVLRYAETDPAGTNGAIDADCLDAIKRAHAPSS